ncbi:MAG: DUF2752 domain-containing protein [Acidobacteriota bacterium]|nr:DUF2752 domain-containing protein [Acidobacteriota bacterium]
MTEDKILKDKISASTVERILAVAGIAAIGAGAFIVGYFNPTTANLFPVCPLYSLTGIHCPGCGLTRGFHALFHGDILTALHFNALLPIYAFVFGFLVVSMFLVAVRGRGLSWKIIPPSAMYGLLILAASFFVLRNLPFYPFNLLAPQ